MRDGGQNHTLKDLNGDLRTICRPGAQTTGMTPTCESKGWDGVVVVKVVLDSVPPEHEVNGMEQRADNVLLWTGVELIFSTAGGMGLRFGFALITVSILQVVLLLLRSTCLHNTNAFSASHIKNGNVLMLTC